MKLRIGRRLPAGLRWLALAPWRLLRLGYYSAEATFRNAITALIQIWGNKVRSVLTVLGIIIAVTSTITVVSVVQGFGNYVTDFLKGIGTNSLWVYPQQIDRNSMERAILNLDDLNAVAGQATKLGRITPLIFSQCKVEYGREIAEDMRLRGVGADFQAIRNFYVDVGRFLGPTDIENTTQVCCLGRDLLDKLYCDESIVGEYVLLDGQRFLVIGLIEEKGSFAGESLDNLVLIPYTAGLKMYPFLKDFVLILSEAVDETSVPEAVAEVTRILRSRHDLKPGQPNDFIVETQDQFLSFMNNVKTYATSALGGIVGISLLVGGIGIMNVMLVSVTERTREIGLRKSVGARRRDIMLQFLTEAVVLATVGGVIGIVLGYAIGHVASLHPNMVEVSVPVWAVALAIGFSAGVGIIFGIIPAFKASILHPIDALRHE
ncbi:MAG TPA: ABC transporter permease [Phycisphaerae bacterium]|nr:ABC transporter permease [Phycisphaerae bacterium]